MPDVGTRKLILKVASTDFSDSVSTVEIVTGDADTDFLPFLAARNGGEREYKLHIVLKQATEAASLWYYAWANAGTEVAVEVWPNGGTVAGVNTPKFSGTVSVREPDGVLLGGEAKASVSAKQTIECEWPFLAKPTMVTA